jgi:hypothetical protein
LCVFNACLLFNHAPVECVVIDSVFYESAALHKTLKAADVEQAKNLPLKFDGSTFFNGLQISVTV